MNHTYRLVWQQATLRYVPAPECAKSKSKSKTDKTRKALAPAAAILSAAFALPAWAQAPPTHALPSGHHVVSGNASVSQAGSQMHIQQGSHKAIIDWASFNIGQDSAVTFAQPDTSAIALNRVTAGDASQIHGQLNANGQVWLVNPNGVVFGAGSQVDVGGLVASSLDISNADFESGNHTFSRNGATGSIINQGTITAKDGGSIALLAPTVRNDGILSAQLGSVAMAAGEQITLQTGDTGLLSVQVAPATLNTLVENRQLIVADGGQVIMTGKAADALAASVVSNSGAIVANSLQEKDGKILLLADMQHGETQVAGTLEAKFIDTSAATVSIDKDLKINTHGGQWLIDPVDITIDSSKASAIETALGTGDVTVSTSNGHTNPGETEANNGTDAGDIHVHADISYTTHQLTLNADRDIHLKAQINVNDSGTLALNYGGTAGNSSATPAAGSTIRAHFGDSGGFKGQVNFANAGEDLLQINGTDYTVIKTAADLQNMQSKLSGKYALGGDVDASGFSGFAPIGSASTPFTGSFDGLGHTISGLTIDHSGQGYVGLFGATSNAALRNVGLEGVVVQGQSHVGGLAGRLNGGSIGQAYVTGTVSGTSSAIGGLVGQQEGGSNIGHAYATAEVSGNLNTGGLVGVQGGGSSISHAYASGTVTGTGSARVYIGGLVGQQGGGSSIISHAYASGQVSGNSEIGGLVGYQSSNNSQISHAYASGAVSGNSDIGGLVGRQPQGSIDHAYYATTDAAGNAINQSSNALGTGKTFAQLADPDLYTGWDSSIWQHTGRGDAVEGYEIALPSLIGVTRAEDVTRSTLFANGWGTEAAAYGIANWEQLSNTRLLLDKHYQLNNDLDSSTSGYAQHASTTANSGAGWQPIGNDSTPFTGSLDGQDHTISGLTINRSGQDYVGLFGETMTASVQRIGLIDAQVTGRDYVGSLVGFNGNSSRISHSYASGGVVQGDGDGVGGLAGANAFDSSISHSYSSSHVQAPDSSESFWVGGLVGSNLDGSTISNSYATGAVTAGSSWFVGGLAGDNDGSTIEQSYATGLVEGGAFLGGLVGNSGDSSNYDNSGIDRDRVDNSYYAITNAAGDTIHNNGAKNKGWGGNAHGTGKTLNAMMNPSLYIDDGWDTAPWTLAGGAAVAGYETGRLPTLTGVTRPQDITHGATLFDGGMGVADNAYGISSWQQLAHIGYNADTLSGGYHFALTENLDSSSTGYATLASETANGGAGWLPLGGTPDGTFTGTFTGTFDGQGHTISNLYIHRPNANNVGLFASTHNATLRDVHLLGGSVTGYDNVGALAGDAYSGYGDSHIHDVSSTANVSGRRYVGALLGAHWASTEGNSLLSDARASGNVQGTLAVGGLAGRNTGNFGTATITRAHATGTVTGGERVGGLVGQNFGGTVAASISEAYATGTVTGDSAVGGLVGINHTNTGTASIANTWASSTVQGGSFGFAGGLVGHNGSDSSIRNSYARGTVSGDDPDYTGGLVGWQQSSAPDALVHSFHTNTDANDDAIPINGWGRIITRAQLLEADTFADWGNDLAIQGGSQAIWRMYDGFTAPQLKAFMQDLEVTHTGVTGGDLGSVEYSGHRAMANAGGSYNHTGSNVQGSLAYITTSKNAQTHSTADGSLVLGGLYSAQYDIRYTPAAPAATLTITPKPLSVSGITAYNKTYDGTTEATLNTSNLLMDGLLPDDRVILESATGTFDNRHAGTDKPVTLSNPIYGGDDAGNYTITTQDSTTADINPAYLSVSTEDVSKTYDGSTQVIGGKLVILYGRELFGSDSLSGGSFAYTDKNAGLGNKTVTVEGVTVDDGNNGDNYTINQVDNESSTILQAPLTISIKDASKTQGSPLTLNGSTGFTADGLIPGETITQVELSSPGTPTNATPGSYTIAASNPSGTAFDANNYSITYQPGTLTVVAQAGGGETGGGETGAGETGGEETGGGETGGGETGSGETGSGETGGGETSEGETGGGETGGGETGGGETGGEETGGGETGGGETGGGETGGEETGGGETGGEETGGGETGGGETGGGETGGGETSGGETGSGETGGEETGGGETDSGETGGGETGGGETGSGETGSGEAGGGETGGGETSGEETGGGETGSGETGGEETGGGETGGGETGGGETGGGETGGGETGGEETGGGETGGGETGGGETGNTLPPSGGAIAQALQQDDEEERQRQARRTPPPSPSGIPYLTLEPGFIPVQGQ